MIATIFFLNYSGARYFIDDKYIMEKIICEIKIRGLVDWLFFNFYCNRFVEI